MKGDEAMLKENPAYSPPMVVQSNKKSKGFDLERKKRRAAWLFILPAMLHFMLFTSLPVFAALGLSLTNFSILREVQWVGLDNYGRILKDDVFWTVVGNTLQYAFWTVLLTVTLALGVAILLDQKLRARTWYRTAFYLPHVTSTAAISVLWIWLYSPQFGLFNAVVGWFGVPKQNWLANPGLAMYAIIIMSVWMSVGTYMVLYLAGLQNIPPELYDAAKVDGAARWALFRYITVPLLKPTTFLVLVTCLIKAFQVFDQIYIMTGGGPGYATSTVAHQIYKQAFENLNLGYASAMAFLLCLLIFGITMINNRLFNWDNVNA